VYRHAYGESEGLLGCEVAIDREAGDFVVKVHHHGQPGEWPRTQVPCPGPEEVGGRGRFVIQQVFDSVRCGECPDGCTVELRKQLPG
jgi:anti-sigma regulatory factor (Ser/Thr protein kinase)